MNKERSKLKMAVVAGASKALKYKEVHPSASESEVINHITTNIREILDNIDIDED
jgi:hypothetical protein